MLVLALDTTTRRGSSALVRDGVVLAANVGDASVTHGERLPGDLVRLLGAHALHMADVDLFAVAAGPGSFTGLRLGIATMQGLALANGKPLAGISALDATDHAVGPAVRASDPHDCGVAVWMDAQRGQVFSARYRGGEAVEAAHVDKPAEILARWERERVRPDAFAGDGALVYRALIVGADPDARIVELVPPLAPSIAALAESRVRQHGASPPDAIRPIYVRRSDAELARDRKVVAS
jgi:tRNA threonylcarbamoyladenosine biosynthesis protein TsaB